MHWHHYLGLVFGLTTLMWVFSGPLSMVGSVGALARRRRAISACASRAGPIDAADRSAARIRAAVAAFRPRMVWDVVVITFSLGGLFLSVTTLMPACAA